MRITNVLRWAGNDAAPVLEVEVAERANGRPRSSGCARTRPGDDRLPTRRFEFVPLWGIKVFLVYATRRLSCPDCGVRVELMPWASGKKQLTHAYAWFLARWARRLSWKEVATVFRASWDSVFRSVEMAVEWGRAHQDLSGIQAIGIDEISRRRGQGTQGKRLRAGPEQEPLAAAQTPGKPHRETGKSAGRVACLQPEVDPGLFAQGGDTA